MRLEVSPSASRLPAREIVVLMGLLLAFGPSAARGASPVSPADGIPSTRSRHVPDRERPADNARSTSTVVAEGTFEGKEGHHASGSYQIEESEDGDLTLTFSEDFEVTEGPDLYVYLSPVNVDNLTSDNATGSEALQVDTLHSSDGQQGYDLRNTLELDDYESVVIYCLEFSALFAGAELDTSIPVELTSFDATMEGNTAHLTWQTASEQNNTGFRVQRRRADSENASWTQIGFVEGAGTTAQPQSYHCKDASLPYAASGLTYRLVQVDTDGTTHPSREITLPRRAPESLRLKAPYPTPAKNRVTVQYEVPSTGGETGVRLLLYDASGRQVKTIGTAGTPGRHERQLITRDLASGMYLLRLVAGGASQSRRLFIVR